MTSGSRSLEAFYRCFEDYIPPLLSLANALSFARGQCHLQKQASQSGIRLRTTLASTRNLLMKTALLSLVRCLIYGSALVLQLLILEIHTFLVKHSTSPAISIAISSNMSSHPKYEPLLGERSSLDFDHAEIEREKCVQQRRSCNVRFHMVMHLLSAVIIFGLLFAIVRMYTFKGCLTHFNAYCLFIDPPSVTQLLFPLLSLSSCPC